MYDSKTVTRMTDYEWRNARAARIESKRCDIQDRRNALIEELRSCRDPFRCQDIGIELQGIRFDLDQLHQEIIDVWRIK